jgi:hypothetical protein
MSRQPERDVVPTLSREIKIKDLQGYEPAGLLNTEERNGIISPMMVAQTIIWQPTA